jgi:hypothetical protein
VSVARTQNRADDLAHGEQEGVAYHGYFGQHQYHPLSVFDGETGQIVGRVEVQEYPLGRGAVLAFSPLQVKLDQRLGHPVAGARAGGIL